MAKINTEELLYQLTQEIRLITLFADQSGATVDALPTAADLARLFQIDRDLLKKLLNRLKEWQLIQAIGMNPKRFRFDQYQFQRLTSQETEDILLQVLMEKLSPELTTY